MNVVTKIFIVLVSLLAVLMVPLVAVNATGATALKERNVEMKAKLSEQKASYDALIAERLEARAAEDFERADQIRDELAAQGIVLEDGAGGTTWRREG